MNYYKILIFSFLALCTACGSEHFVPKPKGWNYIALPPTEYKQTPDSLPYFFEYSTQAKINKDDSYFSERYWIDIDYKRYDARIQISYKPINNDKERLKDFLDDSFILTNKHQIKAYAIEEKLFINKHKHTFIVESLEGEVPTPYQFFVTDSVNHFFRAALYFKTATKNDSLKEVIKYLKNDMNRIMNSFNWNKILNYKYINIADTIRKIKAKRK